MPIGARLIHANSFPNRSPKEEEKNENKTHSCTEIYISSLSNSMALNQLCCYIFTNNLPLGYSTNTKDIGFHSVLL